MIHLVAKRLFVATTVTALASALLWLNPALSNGASPVAKTAALGSGKIPAQFSPTQISKTQLKNWGLSNSEAPSHIQALDAWKIERGSHNVVVAVIDTGIDPSHKSLAANLWHDAQRKDVYGWNFVHEGPNPNDSHGHGTHVAGIIGAVADLDSGVSGVAHRVSIMPVKYYSDNAPGSVNLRNTIQAINYAVEHGANIINYSGGGPEFSQEEYIAIRKAESKGILFVAAAGNEHRNTDLSENSYYPSAYRLTNILSVAATTIRNQLLPASNWGKTTVDVAAPGENIYSTLPNGKFGYMSGTSQATAFVTGLAALLLSHNPKLTPQELKKIIISSVDVIPELKGRLASGGRVNAYQALLALREKKSLTQTTSAEAERPSTAHLPPKALAERFSAMENPAPNSGLSPKMEPSLNLQFFPVEL